MTIDSADDLEGLRRAGRVVANAIAEVRWMIRPGLTTAAVDAVVGDVLTKHRARSAPKLFVGFPGNACIAVNDQAVHGVPGDRHIRAGDLVKVDVTAELDGYVADAAISIPMPSAPDQRRRLADCAASALDKAISVARPGATLRELGRAVEDEVHRFGFTVLREVGGHGVGRTMHESPHVPNWGDPSARSKLREGLVIAIEPIIAAGGRALVKDRDGWTLRTTDGSSSAHCEHTIVVTQGAPIVLTAA